MRTILRLTPLVALLSACDSTITQTGTDDIDALRDALAAFQDVDSARAAGYRLATTCMEHPKFGGMGYHFANPALIDGSVVTQSPELLVYEPVADGSLRLVAIEYLVPFAAWSSDGPLRVLDRELAPNGTFSAFILHVWLWKENPAGLFADWNPNVSCTFADIEPSAGEDGGTHMH